MGRTINSVSFSRETTYDWSAMGAGRLILVAATLLGSASVVGCAGYAASGQSYPQPVTRTAYQVEYGNVIDARTVEIEGSPSIIGVWGGATVGRAIGGGGDEGTTQAVLEALGTVAGAVAGRAIEKKVTSEEGLEITVELDSSDIIAVVQSRDEEFAPGDRVRVLYGPYGSARVRPL